MARLLAWAPLFACLLLLQPPANRTPVTVSAAISLTEALEAAARQWASHGGLPVRFNFAASNVLARQIAAGAPVDLFISADAAQMDVAQASGEIETTTRVDLLTNRLAVVSSGRIAVADLRALLQPAIARIAIGDPDAVPAGVYARQYLLAVGLWEALRPRLVPVGSVRAARAAVESGGADAAFVYESDTAVLRQSVVAFVISDPAAPRIVYPAAIVRRGGNRAGADRFLTFLRSKAAAAIFQQFRFTPVTGTE